MTDWQRSFGENFRAVREAAGITQRWVAEQIGKHQTFTSKMEAGQQTLSLNDAVDLAALLGRPLHTLLGDDNLTAARTAGEQLRASERAIRQRIADEILRGVLP